MKFLGIKPSKQKPAEDGPAINIDLKGVFFKFVTLGILIGISCASVYLVIAKAYTAKDAMLFAYNHPEVIEPVKTQYESEYQSLQDSFAKRQSSINTGEDSPKE